MCIRDSPLTAAVLLVVALVVGVAAVSTLLPVVLGAAFWLALVAETAVRRSLENEGLGEEHSSPNP